VTLETTRGSIRVSDLEGSVLLARTAGGPIEIRNATAVEVAETSSADIEAEIGAVGPNGTSVRVDGGSISLYVASNVNADIELASGSGAVAVGSRGGTLSVAGEFSPQHFKGRIGAGGNTIYAETSSGDVRVYGDGSAS